MTVPLSTLHDAELRAIVQNALWYSPQLRLAAREELARRVR